jgi:hypothetical protein
MIVTLLLLLSTQLCHRFERLLANAANNKRLPTGFCKKQVSQEICRGLTIQILLPAYI